MYRYEYICRDCGRVAFREYATDPKRFGKRPIYCAECLKIRHRKQMSDYKIRRDKARPHRYIVEKDLGEVIEKASKYEVDHNIIRNDFLFVPRERFQPSGDPKADLIAPALEWLETIRREEELRKQYKNQN